MTTGTQLETTGSLNLLTPNKRRLSDLLVIAYCSLFALPGHMSNFEPSKVETRNRVLRKLKEERGDVPGWVLVVLMTTGLVTGIWTLAAPQIEEILRSSLGSMNGIR